MHPIVDFKTERPDTGRDDENPHVCRYLRICALVLDEVERWETGKERHETTVAMNRCINQNKVVQ